MNNPPSSDAVQPNGVQPNGAQPHAGRPNGGAADGATSDSELLRLTAMELAAISESALTFCKDKYDIERFHRIGEIATELSNMISEDHTVYDREVASVAGYTTPKLDVRGAVFDENGRVLLVREIADGDRWTLPGGWCDVMESPSSAVEREVFEESGLRAKATHLAAILDRHLWPNVPKFDRHMYKLIFVCETDEELDLDYVSEETSGVGWFDVEDLPELSVSRILPSQIQLAHSHWKNPRPARFD